jgi:hypothetical protein
MENLNVKIEKLDGNTLTVLQGNFVAPKEPVKIEISGNIDSPVNFLLERVSELTLKKCHLIINRENMTITLVINEDDPLTRGKISGKLELHPDFKKFKINSGETWTSFDLADLIKMNRSFFSSKEVAMKLVSQLRDFQAKVNKQIDAFRDDRANFNVKKAQVVESNLPDVFSLVIPIFKGQAKYNVPVEINIHPESLSCQLCSPEVNDLVNDFKDLAINNQLERIIDDGITGLVIIEG